MKNGNILQTVASQTISEKIKQQETERERKIRLGEMTPFGNALGVQTINTPR